MIKTPVYQPLPGIQFLIFIGVAIGSLIVGNLLALAAGGAFFGMDTMFAIMKMDFTSPNTINALWTLQILGTTLPILIAPLIYAYLVARDPKGYLKTVSTAPWLLYVVAFFVMMMSMPLIELLSRINQQMKLPAGLHGLEEWMRRSEDSAQALTKVMLQMDSFGDLIKCVLLIGLLTAIVEELMFRGVLQTIFVRWTKNTHVAIWVTAALFSAFHMEFYGFLPRLLLGALFGYFVAWSGSIWPAVWGHFLNNGTAVVVTYLYQHKQINIDPDKTDTFNYGGYLFSLIIVIILLLVYKKLALGTATPENVNGEELG